MENDEISPPNGRWFVREQPYSFDLFLENVLDREYTCVMCDVCQQQQAPGETSQSLLLHPLHPHTQHPAAAHVDFAHDSVAGFAAAKHAPLTLELLEDRGPAGFTYRVTNSRPGVRPSILTFAAPCHVSIIEEPDATEAAAAGKADGDVRPGSANPSIRSGLVFYVYPTRPGWSRFHGAWVCVCVPFVCAFVVL